MRTWAVLAVAGAILLAPSSAAVATPSELPSRAVTGVALESSYPGQYIETYSALYYVHRDGTIDVIIDFTFNFNGHAGHGPYVSYPIRAQVDETHTRLYRITNIQASSPLGAPAEVSQQIKGDEVFIRIGDPNVGNLLGKHGYRLTYTVAGLLDTITARDYDASIAPANDTQLWDEFYVDPIGPAWTIPIDDISVIVTGDANAISVTPPGQTVAVDARCFVGPLGSTEPCSSLVVHNGAGSFSQAHLSPGQSMTIAMAFPAGSFDTTPNLRPTSGFLYAFSVNGGTLAGFGVVLALAALWLRWRLRGAAADERYAGLTPGLAPAPGDEYHLVRGGGSSPVAVQFEPPKDVRPGQLGALLQAKAGVRDVTATVVDLAVRGYMRIEGETPEDPDYKFVKLKEADDALLPYEATLFKALFGYYLGAADEATLTDLTATFAGNLDRVESEILANVTRSEWFLSDPNTARSRWKVSGIALVVTGAVASIALAVAGSWGIVPLPLIVVGIVTLFTTRAAPARTAEGSRILAQARGFREFLSTADGNTLRFEEKRDIFSEYLPFAIAFGAADKWTETFAKLARDGAKFPGPTWVGGSSSTFWSDPVSFNRTVTGLSNLTTTVMAHRPPEASWLAGPGDDSGSDGGWGFGGGSGSGGTALRILGGFGGARRGGGFGRGGFSGGGRFGGGGGGW